MTLTYLERQQTHQITSSPKVYTFVMIQSSGTKIYKSIQGLWRSHPVLMFTMFIVEFIHPLRVIGIRLLAFIYLFSLPRVSILSPGYLVHPQPLISLEGLAEFSTQGLPYHAAREQASRASRGTYKTVNPVTAVETMASQRNFQCFKTLCLHVSEGTLR